MFLTEFIRQFKFTYEIYNFFNQDKLAYLKPAYKKYGIRRPIYRSINSTYLAKNGNAPSEKPWLDALNDKSILESKLDSSTFESKIKEQIINFHENGFAAIPSFFSEKEVELINQEIENIISEKKIKFRYQGKKIMFANKISQYIDELTHRKSLTSILDFIMGKKVIPFQTINFINGSGQKTHSDTIHMASYPLGYLIAVWVALEDIHPDSGPLAYYPKSHKLPYILSNEYESGTTKFKIGKDAYKNYELKIEQIIKESDLKKEIFCPKKGDIFIWHANLLHGGSPVINPGLTRKSMVIHYYCEDVICYHEITQRPALM